MYTTEYNNDISLFEGESPNFSVVVLLTGKECWNNLQRKGDMMSSLYKFTKGEKEKLTLDGKGSPSLAIGQTFLRTGVLCVSLCDAVTCRFSCNFPRKNVFIFFVGSAFLRCLLLISNNNPPAVSCWICLVLSRVRNAGTRTQVTPFASSVWLPWDAQHIPNSYSTIMSVYMGNCLHV